MAWVHDMFAGLGNVYAHLLFFSFGVLVLVLRICSVLVLGCLLWCCGSVGCSFWAACFGVADLFGARFGLLALVLRICSVLVLGVLGPSWINLPVFLALP